MVCSLVKRGVFVYCVIQSIADRAPRPCLFTRMSLRLWLPKVRKVISLFQLKALEGFL